jgi:hypothetical protein
MGNLGPPNHLQPHVNALRGKSLASDVFCLLCNIAIVAAEVTGLTLLLVNLLSAAGSDDFVRFLVDTSLLIESRVRIYQLLLFSFVGGLCIGRSDRCESLLLVKNLDLLYHLLLF